MLRGKVLIHFPTTYALSQPVQGLKPVTLLLYLQVHNYQDDKRFPYNLPLKGKKKCYLYVDVQSVMMVL